MVFPGPWHVGTELVREGKFSHRKWIVSKLGLWSWLMAEVQRPGLMANKFRWSSGLPATHGLWSG